MAPLRGDRRHRCGASGHVRSRLGTRPRRAPASAVSGAQWGCADCRRSEATPASRAAPRREAAVGRQPAASPRIHRGAGPLGPQGRNPMRAQTVSILDGSTFVVSDLRGDVDASPTEPHGLFHRDTRFLSRWKLTVDDQPLDVLSTDDLHYFSAQFFLVPGTGSIYTNATWAVVRQRAVGDGFHEDLAVHNYGPEPLGLRIRIDAAADFADLFEVKDAMTKKGEPYRRVENGRLVLGYRRDSYVRETWISSDSTDTRL